MIGIVHSQFGTHPRQAHGLKLLPRHDRQIMGERLVHPYGDFLAGDHLTGNQMLSNNLPSQILTH